jgi:uncharacterized OB-fold protein
MTFPIIERKFPCDPADLLPAITPDSEPFWNALAHGEMVAQFCGSCGKPRFPIAPVCPHCGQTGFVWQKLSGRGKIFSWVRYHRSFLPEFEDLMPYVVITAQFDEGLRMIGRLLERDAAPASGMAVSTVIERWPNGRCVPVFSLAATPVPRGKVC